MNTTEFQATLTRDGYNDIDTRKMKPGCHASTHEHPFDVRAMVLDGQITLTIDGVEQVHRKGDTFDMAAGCSHEENVGPEGVDFLVGRRHPA